MRKILFLIAVLGVGALGGALFSVPLLSALQRIPVVSSIAWLGGEGGGRAVIVNKTEHITVEQSAAIDQARAKVAPALVMVTSLRGTVELAGGQGIIIGSDGLVLARREWISPLADAISVAAGATVFPAKIVRASDKDGLVLLKIETTNLPVVSLANAQERLGDFVFLIGLRPGAGEQRIPFVNAGIVKSVEGKIITTNIGESFQGATGAPLVNMSGEVVGVSAVDSSGYVFAISAGAIREFIHAQ